MGRRALLLALATMACGGALAGGTTNVFDSPQVAAPRHTVGLTVRDAAGAVAGAMCGLDGATDSAQGTEQRERHDHLPDGAAGAARHAADVHGEGYQPFSEHRLLTGAEPEPSLVAHADALMPPLSSAGEAGRVRVDGQVFRREDGSIYQWRGATDFLLFKRFLDGEDVQPILTDRIAAGANLVRVLGMVDSFAHFYPQEHAGYYDQLGAFVDLLAARGLRVEFVVFADAQVVMPDPSAEWVHLDMVARVLSSKWGAFLEVSNEPFKNLPGGGAAACALAQRVRGRGIPVASGHYDFDGDIGGDTAGRCAADFITYHGPRKPEWPRTAKDSLDIRDWAHVPVVQDEPTGFAEQPDGDRRSASVDDAAYFAAAVGLMGAGATFHSNDGITSTAWGPVQAAAARAFYASLAWVPAEAQLAPYMRGGTAPGCQWVGESVVEHDDSRELRSFGKILGNDAYVVQIRSTRRRRAAPGTSSTRRAMASYRLTR
jgi:hypothetical protein